MTDRMSSSEGMRPYVDLLVLEGLLEAPSYGYALSKRIADRTRGEYEVKETTLYSAMRRLERAGAVESFAGDQTNGRPRTYYRLTPAGAQVYRDKIAEWRLASRIVPNFVRDL